MDITQLFKASVMVVKAQRRAELHMDDPKKRILSSVKSSNATITLRDDFARQSKEVCEKITTLRDVLLENRAAYLRIGQHLKSSAHMTDKQRDLIDRESEKFVTYYTQHLGQMRADWKTVKRKPQHRQHMEAVFELLEQYLHSVQQLYLDQKRQRVQYELETYRLLKLAADKKLIPVRPAGEKSGKRIRRQSSNDYSTGSDHGHNIANGEDNLDDEVDTDNDGSDSDMDLHDGWQSEPRKSKITSPKAKPRSAATKKNNLKTATRTTKSPQQGQPHTSPQHKKVPVDEVEQKSQHSLTDDEGGEEKGGLSPEDIQMFEQENVHMYHELQGLSEEVEQIGKNVVDIANLQDIFTEKVSMQQHNIERIANAVIGATENVKDANEQIKQAIQRNAGLRVWSLFFLLVMSFTLLFLDWYYD